jgi:predicted transcriptional regulator
MTEEEVVRDFIAERENFITALKNSPEADADYHRWQGHAEARRHLAERLGLPVPK